MIGDQLIEGISSEGIRERLLSIPDFTLEKPLTASQRMEIAKKDAALFSTQDLTAAVQSTESTSFSSFRGTGDLLPPTPPCFRCGRGSHLATCSNCQAKHARSRKRDELRHFAQVCASVKPSSQNEAGVDCLPSAEALLRQHFGNVPLLAPTKVLTADTRRPLPTMRCLHAVVFRWFVWTLSRRYTLLSEAYMYLQQCSRVTKRLKGFEQNVGRLPLSIKDAVSEDLQRLLHERIIERADASEWISPTVVMQKISGGIRLRRRQNRRC
ncbi:hypothetical protein M513_13033, partial [Trichuris suis]